MRIFENIDCMEGLALSPLITDKTLSGDRVKIIGGIIYAIIVIISMYVGNGLKR